jgi:hypothetical protein
MAPSNKWPLVSVLLLAARNPLSPGARPQASPIDGLGNTSVRTCTRSAPAQRLFDECIAPAWGSDHAGAARSFAETARLDPQRALCECGPAQALTTNVNHPPHARCAEKSH